MRAVNSRRNSATGFAAQPADLRHGQRIRGVKKNEDVFSIQVMDLRERIQGYLKSTLQEVLYEKNSLMPAFAAGQGFKDAVGDR